MFDLNKKEKPFTSFSGFGGGGLGLSAGAGGFDPIAFTSGSAYMYDCTYDSNQDRVVIAYMDQANSRYGTAVVAAITKNSITFGTPVVFESAGTDQISIAYHSAQGKVVICYEDEGNNDYGTAIAGTVNASNNSISFGSPSVFRSATTTQIKSVYDSDNYRVVVGWRDDSSTDYSGKARTINVSGTSVNFGTVATFETGQSGPSAMAFDNIEGKIVIGYNDNENNAGGAVVVGDVDGSGNLTFGSKVAFASGDAISYMSVAYDPSNYRHVITYRDGPDSNKGKARVASVSGTSITLLGSPVEFSSSAAYTSAVYDSANQKIVVSYMDGSNSNYGTSKVGTVSGSSINFGSATVWNTVTSSYLESTYDPDTGKIIPIFSSGGRGKITLV
jgi:hypothetical protein